MYELKLNNISIRPSVIRVIEGLICKEINVVIMKH